MREREGEKGRVRRVRLIQVLDTPNEVLHKTDVVTYN